MLRVKIIYFLKLILSLLVALPTHDCHAETSYVTYQLSPGRFGDNLIAYYHAKWFEYLHHKAGMRLLYKSFRHSNELMLHKFERHYQQHKHQSVYEIPYFPESVTELQQSSWPFFAVDWNNQEFKALLRTFVTPIIPIPPPHIPHGFVSVALHVRKGGGYWNDDARCISMYWYKFPPDTYYIECLIKLMTLFPHKKFYIYLFTDDSCPGQIAATYKKSLYESARTRNISLPDHQDIRFDYRRTNNAHDKNVVADFFAMTQFDCLIMPESNFSIAASKLGDFMVVMGNGAITYGQRFHNQQSAPV